MNLFSYIPSPGSSAIHLGPLQLRAYGLMIALGVILGVRLWGKRMTSIGIGSPEQVNNVAMWAVPAGVIGARLYHVATEWGRFSDHPIDIIKIWKGGLGIPGGMLLGIIVGVWALKRESSRCADLMGGRAGLALGSSRRALGELVESRVIWQSHNFAVGFES